MKSWENLDADENLILSKHMTKGRQGHKVDKIIIHHNAGNLSARQIYETWQTREASAHYQVDSNGRISQHVWDADTAWHAGNWQANLTSIGVEHADISSNPWALSEATLDAGAHLVAALCRHFGLGRPQWRKNVFPHSDFTSTSCPASLSGSQNAAYMARAQEWYDKMTGVKTSAPAAAKPAAKPASNAATLAAGAYRVVASAGLNVRDRPSTAGAKVAAYKVGQTVNLDGWSTTADGYIWGRYKAYSGATRYVAVGTANGSATYLRKA